VAKLTPKVILEGTRLTHKTDLALALNEHPRMVGPRRYRYHSPLISGEWCGFSPYPWGHGLINFDGPDEEALALEAYSTWTRLFELLPHYSWIVDRFHLSTMAYQRAAHARDYDFGWLEDRLLVLGFHVVLCTRRDETFESARADRLLVSGHPDQYDDLSIFVREQEDLRQIAARSRLPVLELDMSDGDIERGCTIVADWLEGTGGLWAPQGAEP